MSYSFHIVPLGDQQVYFVCSVGGQAQTNEVAKAAYDDIAHQLRQRSMDVVHERVFGSVEFYTEVMEQRRRAFVEQGLKGDGPVTYVDGSPPHGRGLAGMIVRAVCRDCACPLELDGERVGTSWQMNGLSYVIVQNLSSDVCADGSVGFRATETETVFERAEMILKRCGMTFRDTVRTWCYLGGILDWYDEFNRVRSEVYRRFGVMPVAGEPLRLPASTGIGVGHPKGVGLTVDLLAVRDTTGSPARIERLSNCGQRDAFCYGSAFSRAAVIQGGRPRVLQLSGTAAIDESGETMHLGNCGAQIETTLEKVSTLISTQGASLSDLAAATVIVKRPEYAEIFHDIIRRRGLKGFPAVCIVADVCRDDLLFELDGEVVLNNQ